MKEQYNREYAKCLKIAIDIYTQNNKKIIVIDRDLINELHNFDKTTPFIEPLYNASLAINGDQILYEVIKYYMEAELNIITHLEAIKEGLKTGKNLLWHNCKITKIDLNSMNFGGKLSVRLEGTSQNIQIDLSEISIKQ